MKIGGRLMPEFSGFGTAKPYLIIDLFLAYVYVTDGLFVLHIGVGRNTLFKISLHESWAILVVIRNKIHRVFPVKTFWKFLRKLGIRKPFKGSVAYEWQVLDVYFQLFYPRQRFLQSPVESWSFGIGIDTGWRYNTIWEVRS